MRIDAETNAVGFGLDPIDVNPVKVSETLFSFSAEVVLSASEHRDATYSGDTIDLKLSDECACIDGCWLVVDYVARGKVRERGPSAGV